MSQTTVLSAAFFPILTASVLDWLKLIVSVPTQMPTIAISAIAPTTYFFVEEVWVYIW